MKRNSTRTRDTGSKSNISQCHTWIISVFNLRKQVDAGPICESALLFLVISVSGLFIPDKFANAEAIGMPFIATPNIGYSVGIANLDIDDPDGTTSRLWIFQPVKVVYTDKITGKLPYRYWLELYYQEGSVDASVTDIGQFVTQYGIRASLQKKMWRSELWQSWLGAGIDLASSRYKNRHLVDSDGFLVTRLDNRNVTNPGILINFSGDTKLARNVTLSARAEQLFSFNNGINLFSVTATFLYRL